jgi:4-aminobutyrate aminotransferase
LLSVLFARQEFSFSCAVCEASHVTSDRGVCAPLSILFRAGRKLLDFTSGIGVTNTGHCHPKVVKAAQDQVGKLMHVQMGIAYHEPVLQLAEELKTVVPKGLDQFFFSNR